MNAPAFRAALRMARREALRSKWRSLLVVLLIGFPVFVLGTADIAWRTWQLDPSERVTREIGQADAGVMLQQGCGSVEQAPSAWLGGQACGSDNGETSSADPSPADLFRRLPAGTRTITRIGEDTRITTAAGVEYADLEGFDYADPVVRGIVTQLHGRAPRTAAEVALTSKLASSIGAKIGSTVHFLRPDRTMTVVGIVQDAKSRADETAYSVPAAVDQSDQSLSMIVYLRTPTPVTWPDVLALNKASYLVLSRSVYLDPPPRSQVPFYQHTQGGGVPKQVVATLTLIVGMALLEVVLLAGPAFAVGARRQRRDLALIAATGGENRDLRNVVLAGGVVLGVVAGVSATVGAVLAALIGVPTLGSLVDQIPGHIDVRPLELGGIACLSVVTALLAAVFPALQAARTDVVSALAGRRGTVRVRPHVPVAGGLLAALGALVAIAGVTRGNGSVVILSGVVIIELGLIMCTPALLGVAARLGRALPLAPRIALRDAGRNRSAATPAVAAVMASMIGAVGILIAVTSAQDQNKRSYTPELPNHAVWADVTGQDGSPSGGPSASASAAAFVAALRATLPVADTAIVHTTGTPCLGPGTRKVGPAACQSGDPLFLVRDTREGARYRGGMLPEVVVDDGSGVAALFGKAEPAAVAALRAGHAVVTDDTAVHDGRITLGTIDQNAAPTQDGSAPITSIGISLPATVVTDGFAATAAIVPPSAVSSLGTPVVLGVLATTSSQPTARQLQAARGRLETLDPSVYLYNETGYHNPSQWQLYALIGVAAAIALGAASIATSLANTDGRDDLVTLGAVGASPRTRRLMSMSRAGVIAGLGCAIGVAAGFVPAYAWTRGDRAQIGHGGTSLRFIVPWPPILLALFGIPLVAAALAGLVTRSRLPSERLRV